MRLFILIILILGFTAVSCEKPSVEEYKSEPILPELPVDTIGATPIGG